MSKRPCFWSSCRPRRPRRRRSRKRKRRSKSWKPSARPTAWRRATPPELRTQHLAWGCLDGLLGMLQRHPRTRAPSHRDQRQVLLLPPADSGAGDGELRADLQCCGFGVLHQSCVRPEFYFHMAFILAILHRVRRLASVGSTVQCLGGKRRGQGERVPHPGTVRGPLW